jgi:hypothetical protein
MSLEPLNTEAYCDVCESWTAVTVSENIATVELACDWCGTVIRYTFPRYMEAASRIEAESPDFPAPMPDLDLVELSPQQPYEDEGGFDDNGFRMAPIMEGELCADCDNPAVIRQVAGMASYGFCAEHKR